MTDRAKPDLAERVRRQVECLSRESAAKAVALVQKVSEGGEQEEEDAAVVLADLFEELESKQRPTPRKSQSQLRAPSMPPQLEADSKVTAASLLDSLRPDVESFRRSVFLSRKPPFRNKKEATEWIEQGRWEGLPFPGIGKERRIGKGVRRYVDLHGALYRALDDLRDFTGLATRITFDHARLAYYQSRSKQPTEVQVKLGSTQEYLAEFVEDAAKRTGFSGADLTAFVLTGKEPSLKRLELDEEKKGPLSEVVITIRAQSPCWEDLVSVYRAMQRKRGKRKKASLFDERDLEVLKAVQALGGPPKNRECNKQFWQDVLRRLPSRGRSKYKDWRGPMMRWRRLPEKNPRLGEIEPCIIAFAD